MLTFFSCKNIGITEKSSAIPTTDTLNSKFEMKGMSFVGMNHVVNESHITPLGDIYCNWISQMPFAFGEINSTQVTFNHPHQWWGESDDGIITTTLLTQAKGIKTMMKPQIWMSGTYTGEFSLTNDNDWKIWEKNYLKFIMHFAHLSDSLNIEMFCIGTELKQVVEKRPDFFITVIDSIKTFYTGKLVYAANWNEYKQVHFWNKLDYIGIDAYFPLSSASNPTLAELKTSWTTAQQEIDRYRKTIGKDVIFTEIGYKSVDKCAYEPWNPASEKVNLTAQSNATLAFFEVFNSIDWFKGSFFWKWYPKHHSSGGHNNTDYTPQNKPVEAIIKKWYKETGK
jgi:hypothetical protein